MIILVHSETSDATLTTKLGRAEYSYFFVLRAFRPVLERIGLVVRIGDPEREVDRLYDQARSRGEPCIFLSFSPPHRTQMALACPTIPVFAWEFDSISHEQWDSEPQHDWTMVLRRLGGAIVHSRTTVDVVRQALGPAFPVHCIPAPMWDAYAPYAGLPIPEQVTLKLRGTVIDTAALDLASLPHHGNWVEVVQMERARLGRRVGVSLGGVVYSSVLNPEDGRKNWTDMLAAFCRVFRDTADATLVLKLTHHDGTWGMALMLKLLRRLTPFACRVVLIHGFLPDADYARLVAITTYTVNTSHGEGQCLPLMEAMSAGKPAIAPAHSGMADYLDETCAFLVRSSAEPAAWPQDSRGAIRTHRRRIDLGSLERAYSDSHATATGNLRRYAAMSAAASERLRRHCSAEIVQARLRTVLNTALGLPDAEADAEPSLHTGEQGRPSMQHPAAARALLDQRLASLAYFATAAPPNLDEYDWLDPADRKHAASMLKRCALRCSASPGNAVLIHRAAGRALSETPVYMHGSGNVLILDRDCAMHGRIEMTGDGNLAVFLGGQTYLAMGLTLYGHDTLMWGRGASSWGIRVWVQGGTTCSIGEGCLFSENITIRTTDHHSIIDLASGDTLNRPADVVIGKHVWISQDCAIGKGVTIGDGAIIGLRSTVVGPIGRAELWAGTPARKLRDGVSWTMSHPAAVPREVESVQALLAGIGLTEI